MLKEAMEMNFQKILKNQQQKISDKKGDWIRIKNFDLTRNWWKYEYLLPRSSKKREDNETF